MWTYFIPINWYKKEKFQASEIFQYSAHAQVHARENRWNVESK